jgi:hypothetical protein
MILGIGGKAGAGKTTFAKIAAEYGFIQASFSQALKQEVVDFLKRTETRYEQSNLYGTPEEKDKPLCIQLKDVFASTSGLTPDLWLYELFHRTTIKLSGRHLLQLWGTEFRRENFGEDYWVRKLIDNLRKDLNYVIDDVRFANESRIADTMVLIVRPDFSISRGDHKSEAFADNRSNFTYIIHNDGTLEEYIAKCVEFVRKVKN